MLFLVLGGICYTFTSIFVKLAHTHVDLSLVLLFRFGIGFVIIAIIMLFKQKVSIKTKHPYLQFIRGFGGVTAIACFFFAIDHIPLTEATLLAMTMPLFVPIILRLTRRISIIPSMMWTILIGLVGVAIVMNPTTVIWHYAVFFALASAIIRALSSTVLRQLTKAEHPLTILFYYMLAGCFFSIIFVLLQHPTVRDWPWLLLGGIGLLGIAFQACITLSLKYLPARIYSPMTNLFVIFAGIADWLIWHQYPTFTTLIGFGFILVSAWLTYRKARYHL